MMALSAVRTFLSCLKVAVNMQSVILSGQAGDGREKALLEHVLKTAERGNPASVLNTIDAYAKSGRWLMNLGDDKGPILDAALHKFNPALVLEVGTFCGYSAVRIASQLRRPGSKLLSFEMNPDNCRIAMQIIDHAGLSSKVEVVEGKFEERVEVAKRLLEEKAAAQFDFVFMDHWKDSYLADYLLLKQHGLIGDGSGICADNMGPKLAPADFKEYMQTHTEELTETVEYKSNAEYLWWFPDSVTVSTFKIYHPSS